MADSPRADDGKGSPKGSPEKTTAPQPADARLIPGGRFGAPAVGVNAFDRADLPSFGLSPQIDATDAPNAPNLTLRE